MTEFGPSQIPAFLMWPPWETVVHPLFCGATLSDSHLEAKSQSTGLDAIFSQGLWQKLLSKLKITEQGTEHWRAGLSLWQIVCGGLRESIHSSASRFKEHHGHIRGHFVSVIARRQTLTPRRLTGKEEAGLQEYPQCCID